jgi:hypothetical protein
MDSPTLMPDCTPTTSARRINGRPTAEDRPCKEEKSEPRRIVPRALANKALYRRGGDSCLVCCSHAASMRAPTSRDMWSTDSPGRSSRSMSVLQPWCTKGNINASTERAEGDHLSRLFEKESLQECSVRAHSEVSLALTRGTAKEVFEARPCWDSGSGAVPSAVDAADHLGSEAEDAGFTMGAMCASRTSARQRPRRRGGMWT